MITKMELVEGELGRFAMIRGEELPQTYNRLKTLVTKSKATRVQDGRIMTSSDSCSGHSLLLILIFKPYS
jgi:hypothetical protein